MKILGIDPGTAIVGFGVIERVRGKTLLHDAGVIRTPSNLSDEIRLKQIYDDLYEVITSNNPDVVVIEKLFFAQNVTTAMTVSQARGVILLAATQCGVPVAEYTPLQVKQGLTGYGRATKQQIQEMVKVLLGLKRIPKPDDCADALAIALLHSTAAR